MRRVSIDLVCMVDGEILVPAATLSSLLRNVGDEVSGWSGPDADPPTVAALTEMLGRLADRIDVDCIELATEAAEDEP